MSNGFQWMKAWWMGDSSVDEAGVKLRESEICQLEEGWQSDLMLSIEEGRKICLRRVLPIHKICFNIYNNFKIYKEESYSPRDCTVYMLFTAYTVNTWNAALNTFSYVPVGWWLFQLSLKERESFYYWASYHHFLSCQHPAKDNIEVGSWPGCESSCCIYKILGFLSGVSTSYFEFYSAKKDLIPTAQR